MSEPRFIYTLEERQHLIYLVNKYKDVLENRGTNNCSVKVKNQAWERLGLEYCSDASMRPRSAKQLKKLWENEKAKWKKNDSADQREVHRTGK